MMTVKCSQTGVWCSQEKEKMEERLESSGEGQQLVVSHSRGLSDWDVRSL